MSDHEQIDVTSTDDTADSQPITASSKCGYCDCEKEGLPVFHCDSCGKWVHTSCLHSGSPSPILFDNFYVFKCISCGDNGKESFARMRMTWNQVTALALFNIAQSSPGKQGFHKWKDAVGSFMDKHWDLLFESYKKKSGNWVNTVAATLSSGNPHQFTSGYGYFKESGWWKLTDPTKPPEYTPATIDSKQSKTRKTKSYPAASTPPSSGKLEGLRKRPYFSSALNASQLKEKRSRTQDNQEIRTREFMRYVSCQGENDGVVAENKGENSVLFVAKDAMATRSNCEKTNEKSTAQVEYRKGNNTPPSSDDSPPSFKGCGSPISSPLSSPRSLSVTSMLSKGDMVPDSTLPLAILSDDSDVDQEQNVKTKTPSSPDGFFSPLPMDLSAMSTPCVSPPTVEEDRAETSERPANGKTGDLKATLPHSSGKSAFSVVQKKKKGSSKDSDENMDEDSTSTSIFAPSLPEMSLYEERALLKKLESYGDLIKEVPEACRLQRKLLVRQKKRELNVPITSFDTTARKLISKEHDIPLHESDNPLYMNMKYLSGLVPSSLLSTISSPHHRILDRFQSAGFSLQSEMHHQRTFRQKLVGCDEAETLQSIISPYTQRILKPYIRRDYETKPPKLAVMEEIVSRYVKRNKTMEIISPPSAPIDFSYVRPHLIPTINTMCQHFFWPGIDLSESLQYPDFSIVALYKKMVIGFGFMVPDVNFNEAYISFLLIHPDWQHAGIGTFMIYHLIQTCMGKEVTIHVSASNPAMLLYQKFGFKPEKFITDFYDKYYAYDSTECKHAFFMRLRR